MVVVLYCGNGAEFGSENGVLGFAAKGDTFVSTSAAGTDFKVVEE